MIPASSISFNDDGTAWVVGTEWWATVIMRDAQDRPCDTLRHVCNWGQRRDIEPPHLVTQLPRPMAIYVDADHIAKATVTIPPDSQPGMWAVKLTVHE